MRHKRVCELKQKIPHEAMKILHAATDPRQTNKEIFEKINKIPENKQTNKDPWAHRVYIPFVGCCCSVAKLGPTLCNPMDCSTPGFPVLHYLLELAQTHVHCANDTIQPSHPLSLPSPPALNISQL